MTGLSFKLPVRSVTGPMLVTDGPWVGRRASRVDLSQCAAYCECHGMPVDWGWARHRFESGQWKSAHEILDKVTELDTGTTVIGGGDPLMWQYADSFPRLIAGLKTIGDVVVETDGVIAPRRDLISAVDQFLVWPMVGDPDWPLHGAYLAMAARGKASFLVTCADSRHVYDTLKQMQALGIDARHVWICPGGLRARDVSMSVQRIANATVLAGFNLSSRIILE